MEGGQGREPGRGRLEERGCRRDAGVYMMEERGWCFEAGGERLVVKS